ncbi:hypothetical protein [Tautonia sociabilis]|uniref:Uncharacterized protein n=1 Tax=Tautonia sociabilis TaxID=2080755 RepID=A0A432MJY3_9BACT|nr:hypothetical protein [Tautonia sociabilis]RUL87438.1 hypothetical protein TsocGM_12210 [Tautonia sociabilis]
MNISAGRRSTRWSALACLAGLVVCGEGGGAVPREETGPLPELVRLEPGAEVSQGPPRGWSHRVMRSVPRLSTGDLADLPESAGATATRFRTVIAAEVVADPRSGARLARVGLGNAVPVGELELVVTPEGPKAVLRRLGVVDRVVLLAAQAKLDQGVLLARSPTFALSRNPTVLVVDGEHRETALCYAILVDPDTGALTTLCWPIPGPGEPLESVTLLAPGLSFDAPIDVRATRRVGPVVVSWSFALGSPPPGRRIDLPGPIARVLARPDANAPEAVERALRSLLDRAR